MNKILRLAALIVGGCLSFAPIHVNAMTTEHGYFSGVGDVEIFYQCWKVEHPRAVMIIVHGFGEHSDRYMEMAQHFAEMGISSYAVDHRGHGRSEGPRWNPESFDYYIDDLKTYVEMVKRWEPGKDIFMLGHSLGGEIALKYAILHPEALKGLITSAPAVGGFLNISMIGSMAIPDSMLRILSPFLSIMAKVMPDRGMSGTQIDPKYLNHDLENYMAYADDPMVCHEPMKLRFQSEAGKNLLFLHDNANNLVVPCLIMNGSKDMLVPPNSVKEFYDKVQVEDKTFITYDGFYHEIFNEVWKDEVYQNTDAWLLPRLSS